MHVNKREILCIGDGVIYWLATMKNSMEDRWLMPECLIEQPYDPAILEIYRQRKTNSFSGFSRFGEWKHL